MHEIRIKPDFNKLKHYYPDTDERKRKLAKSQGIKLRLNYSDDESPFIPREEYQMDLNLPKVNFIHFVDKLESILEEHGLDEHYNEIMLITLMANENLDSIVCMLKFCRCSFIATIAIQLPKCCTINSFAVAESQAGTLCKAKNC